jgi:hypothetical protein
MLVKKMKVAVMLSLTLGLLVAGMAWSQQAMPGVPKQAGPEADRAGGTATDISAGAKGIQPDVSAPRDQDKSWTPTGPEQWK